ncbi:MAG: hypothetical protein ACUVS8_14440 [Armatimonadota bacterium]
MAVRATMAELIGRVRALIGDRAGADQTFDDQTIQDSLDRHRVEVRYLALSPLPSYAVGGVVEIRTYRAPAGDWEADETLYSGEYAPLSPSAADRLTGQWTFPAHQPPPVLIVGKTYDVYAAAADLLETWAAAESRSFDFDADGQSFKRSQKAAMLRDTAREYRRKQRPDLVPMVRGDVSAI